MDVPAERSTRTAGPQLHPAARHAAGPRRRRPTGEPPPLPHHLQTSGIRWLVATLVLVVLVVVVFARGLHGLAVDVAVFDAAVVGWLGGIDLPGFRALMRGLAALSSWWVLNPVAYGLIVVLLVLRRFRHLIIWLVLTNVLSNIGGGIIGPVAQRPRPFGAVIREGWGGWAMPPLHVSFFAIGLVAILYTLVPEGRWRNTGKWVVTVLVALTAIGRMALGTDGPTDVLVGVALGVTIPLLAFRWFTPNEIFPITYRRGSGAHLDVSGVRRYQRVERQAPLFTVVRFDVFPGGCVTTRIRTPTAYRAEVAGSAAGLLGFTSRDQLSQALEQRSGGRLHLDPARGR